MTAISDTFPLNYLVLIDEIDLLPGLFGDVLLPGAVLQELNHEKTPLKVREWGLRPPPWIEVRTGAGILSPDLLRLDLGEREAIQLALEFGVDTILVDEAEGRRVAQTLRLEVRGTLGILEHAARLGMIDFRSALNKLEQTRFRLSPEVRTAFLERNP